MLRMLAMLTLVIAIPIRALAHENGQHAGAHPGTQPAATPKQRAAQLFFSDRQLITQHGKAVAFYTDVLRDNVVLINFIFTQCTDSCPTQTARLAAVQSMLADAANHAIRLVSISVDPAHDTPQALDAYARQFGARDGWLFLTGSKTNIDDVLRRVDHLAPSREAHTTLFIAGNERSGHWIRLHPDTDPAEIAHRLRLLAAETVAEDDSR
jgi:protein SCO1